MSFVYAAPPLPPPAPVQAWGRMSSTWTGWDGSEWDLTNPHKSPVFLKQDGTEGMHMPSHVAWTSSSPAVHGQTFRGYSVQPREAFWPIFLYSDKGSREWLEIDAAFWRTLQPGKHGRWSVTTPYGGTRTLHVRSADNGGFAYTADPMRRGWVSYPVALIADDPFWYGEPVRQAWSEGESVDFFGGAGKAPLFHISSASQFTEARISNAGDVEAWPVWTVKGPGSGITLGVGGRQIDWSGTLTAGDILVVDADPRVQSAWLNGVDVTHQLESANFAPIPAGEDRRVSVSMVGSGSVSVEIAPRFLKAW